MAAISISSRPYSNAEFIVKTFAEEHELRIITDQEIIRKTGKRYGFNSSVIKKVTLGRQPAFNDFTRLREKSMACLKQTASNFMSQGDIVIHGLMGHLIPKDLSHVTRMLITSDKANRVKNGVEATGLPEKKIIRAITRSDNEFFKWTRATSGRNLRNNSFYDVVIPAHKMDISQSISIIKKQIKKTKDIPEFVISREREDFAMEAKVERALAGIGCGLFASVCEGNVLVTIDRYVIMLSRLKRKIMEAVRQIPGVKTVDMEIGSNFYSRHKLNQTYTQHLTAQHN